MIAQYLVDKSAWMRMNKQAVADRLVPLIEQGLVGTCGILDLEILVSTRSGPDHERIRAERRYTMEHLSMPDEIWDRAIAVQGQLAHVGQHRSVKLPDLLIAATAERHNVTVLHYDADYDRIAAITGQPTEWAVPAGTAD